MKNTMRKNKIVILVVSFNRKDFVLKNIEAVQKLLFKEHDVILFDNGSTDGTIEVVEKLHKDVIIIKSNENLGGAGGFAEGLKQSYQMGYEYVWCLDDDGYPQNDSLSILMEEIKTHLKPVILGTWIIPSNYNQNAISHFWPIHGKYDRNKKKIVKFSSIEKKEIIQKQKSFETASVALLGMFVSREVIEKIGYPQADLFLSNDDVEYCLRSWTNDIPVILVQKAILFHPPNTPVKINLGIKKIDIMLMAPWKLYYYVRNTVYVGKKYFSLSIYLKFILISFIVIVQSFFANKGQKYLTLKAGFIGLNHGFRKLMGKYNIV